MTITIELQPEIEKGLVAKARLHGVSLAQFAQEILAREVHITEAEPVAPVADADNLYELFAPVRGLLTDEEADTLFARNRSLSRPVNFE